MTSWTLENSVCLPRSGWSTEDLVFETSHTGSLHSKLSGRSIYEFKIFITGLVSFEVEIIKQKVCKLLMIDTRSWSRIAPLKSFN